MDILSSWREEKRSAYIYTVLSDIEPNPIHKKLFTELSHMAETQAKLWEQQLHQSGTTIPSYLPDARTRFILWLTRHLGARSLRLTLAAMKVRGMSIYHMQPLQYPLTANFVEKEAKHRGIKSAGNLRAAIFGVSDGLLSNASLIFGVAGAHVDQQFLLLSGIAGLLAGAFSMGAGEYLSVSSQRQMLEYQLALEKQELDTYPEEEAAELALIYEARGLPTIEAKELANRLIKNPERALDTLAREELGLNPEELGSPWGAAFSSFFSFTVGAFIPLLPFLVSSSSYNLVYSVLLTAIAFFCVGSLLNLFTQRNVWLGGIRMVTIGGLIGVLTYCIGKLFGISLH